MIWGLSLVVLVMAIVVYRLMREPVSSRRAATAMQDLAPQSLAFVPVKARLQIEYSGADANRSRREISVHAFSDVRDLGLLKTFCHRKNAPRTFRIDSIRSCVDLDTGLEVDDVRSHLRALAGIDSEEAAPTAMARSDVEAMPRDSSPVDLLDSWGDLMRVLLFVAKEEDLVNANKQSIMAGYLQRVTGDTRITPASVRLAAERWGKPSLVSFQHSVERIVADGELNAVLMAGCCRHLAEEDGKITRDEGDALEFLDDRVMSLTERR